MYTYWPDWSWKSVLSSPDWYKDIKIDGDAPFQLKEPNDNVLIQTQSELDALAAKIREAPFVSFDAETNGLDIHEVWFKVAGLCISLDTQTGYYIPIHHRTPDCGFSEGLFTDFELPYNLFSLQEIRDFIRLSGLDKKPLIGHNIRFDLHVLKHLGIEHVGPVLDTLLLCQVEDAYRPNRLKPRVSEFFGYTPMDFAEATRNEDKDFTRTDPRYSVDYAAPDPVNTLRLAYYTLMRETAESTYRVCETVEFPLVPKIVNIERFGVDLNTDKLEAYSRVVKPHLEELERTIRKDIRADVNLRSSEERYNLVYEHLRCPFPGGERPNRKGGATSDALRDIEKAIPEVVAYLEEASNELQPYLDGRHGVFDGLRKTWDALNVARIRYKPLANDSQITTAYVKYLLDTMAEARRNLNRKVKIVKLIGTYNKLTKLFTSFIKKLPKNVASSDNKLHTDFTQILKSGRMAGRNPNLMQLPRDSVYTIEYPFIQDIPENEVQNKLDQVFGPGQTWRYQNEEEKTGARLVVVKADIREALEAPEGYVFCCVDGDSRVLTEGGPRKLRDITLGDRVLSAYGKYHEVTWWKNNGVKKCLKLKTRHGYEITVTPDHKMKVVDKTGSVVDREAQDIRDDDHLILQHPELLPQFATKLGGVMMWHPSNTPMKTPATNELLALFTGITAGDGTLQDNYIGVECCKEDQDVIEFVEQTMADLFGNRPRVYDYGGGSVAVKINSRPLSQWIKAGLKATKEAIPGWVWQKGLAEEYLRGLFETDGNVGDWTVSVKAKDAGFARDIQELLLAIGIPSKRALYDACYKEHKIWTVSIKGLALQTFADKVGFIGQRKRSLLESVLAKKGRKTHYDYIPASYDRMKAAYKQEPGNARSKIYRKVVNCNSRNLTRDNALALTEKYPAWAARSGVQELLKLNAFFDKLESIEEAEAEVFDISVPGPESFVAGGFHLHNCADWDSMEMKMAAVVTGCPSLNKVVNGRDKHGRVYDPHLYAMDLMGVFPGKTYEQLRDIYENESHKLYKKLIKERQAIKTIQFGILYGQTVYGLAATLGISIAEAQKKLDRYFAAYPGVARWISRVHSESEANGFAQTVLGRRRYVPEWAYDSDFRLQHFLRACGNHEIQGGCGDIAKFCVTQICDALKNHDAHYCNFIHDENIVAVKNDPDTIAYVCGVLVGVMQKLFGGVEFTAGPEVKTNLGKKAVNLLKKEMNIEWDTEKIYEEVCRALGLKREELATVPWAVQNAKEERLVSTG